MSNTVIAEGKTTAEAIENGLKQLKVSKNDVDVTVLKDENKKSFFNILAPRTVRVELKLKEKHNENKNIKKGDYEYGRFQQSITGRQKRNHFCPDSLQDG